MEKITLFSTIQETGELGDTKLVSKEEGVFHAEVTQITGSRLFQYQKQGIQYPISIETRYLKFTPSKGIWRDREFAISSVIEDSRNRKTFIEGALK